jgi:TonB family protein
MIRLDPAHKPLLGVSAAAFASVPLIVVFFLLLVPRSGSAPTAGGAVQVPAAVVAAPATLDTSRTTPAVRPPEPIPSKIARSDQQRVALATKKAPVERVLYSMRWSDGAQRRKIAGKVPRFPAGVTVEAMARAELVVTGAGAVRSAKLLQTGNPRCDDATLREIRLWKFDPLPRPQKQPDQRCVITVSFTRK